MRAAWIEAVSASVPSGAETAQLPFAPGVAEMCSTIQPLRYAALACALSCCTCRRALAARVALVPAAPRTDMPGAAGLACTPAYARATCGAAPPMGADVAALDGGAASEAEGGNPGSSVCAVPAADASSRESLNE